MSARASRLLKRAEEYEREWQLPPLSVIDFIERMEDEGFLVCFCEDRNEPDADREELAEGTCDE